MSAHLARVCWTLVEAAAKIVHLTHALETLYNELPGLSHGELTFGSMMAFYVLFDLAREAVYHRFGKRPINFKNVCEAESSESSALVAGSCEALDKPEHA